MISVLFRNSKLFFSLLFISLLLIFLDNLGTLNILKSGVQFITAPVQYGLYKSSLNFTNQFNFLFFTRKTLQEKKAVEVQLAQVLSENANLRRKLSEAEGFLKQQNSLNPQTFHLIATRPIGVSRYLIIDKGSDDGVAINQTVIFQENYIGRVKTVSPKRSEVMLLSDPDSKISAYVANKDGRARGLLLGQFGNEILLDKVLHQEPMGENDLVYTDGTEVEIPKGLVLGQVSEVLERDVEAFKQAKVKGVFEPGTLDVVFVITN